MGGKTIITAIVLFWLLPILKAEELQVFNQQYGPFDSTYATIFEIKPPALISNGALQLTPERISTDFDPRNHSGRVLLKRPFRFWEADNSSTGIRVLSFKSSFLMNIYRPFNESPGEGLAFLISPDLEMPINSFGQFLGLTNETLDGKSSNKIFAVEFDTFKQDFDPDDNHLALDIHSVVDSVVNVSLRQHGIELAPFGQNKLYNVWIQYDGADKLIEVYIAEKGSLDDPTPPRPLSAVLKTNLDLRNVINQESHFGFSASTGNCVQLNSILSWNLTVYHPDDNNNKLSVPTSPGQSKIVLKVGLPILLLLFLGVIGLGFYYFFKRRKRRIRWSHTGISSVLKRLPGCPREFEIRDLKKATNNFDEKNKLGQGGFGMVFKGILANENLEIAVKCFLKESIEGGQDDFLAELSIINRLRHKHLVKLLGWCHKNGKLILVYEYMPRGSLDKHLFVGADKQPLGWKLRYNIITGVASALHYLHNEYDQKVVHRDLKASNIMLDSDFNARLGDFGLARALENEKTSYAEVQGVPGTIGYIAPECLLTGKATRLSDVYAFGAVVLEVVCGRRPGNEVAGFDYLVDWVWYLHREGQLLDAVDPRLGKEYNGEEAKKLLLLGLACSHPTTSERPDAGAILQIISGALPVPYVSPFRPAFVWPEVGRNMYSSTSEATSDTNSFICSGR